ncbi:MAG TPA: hypothetical protein VK671_03085 [Mucilaginibacter sp.]|jgi:hypothetical protein|nr:hypothetical protein [Mucilaginibacter sp.]
MKNYKKTPANKLLTRFDNELKSILVNDLNNNKSVKQQLTHSNQQVRLQVR